MVFFQDILDNLTTENNGESFHLDLALYNYQDVLASETKPISTDFEFMRIIELLTVLKSIRENSESQLIGTFSRPDSIVSKSTNSQERTQTTTDKKLLFHVCKTVDQMVLRLQQHVEKRLSQSKKLPRILQLCTAYHFSLAETNFFLAMAVIQGSRSSLILNSVKEDDLLRRVSLLLKLAKMSEVELELFCDSERQHVKEGMVLMEDDQGLYYHIRIPRTAVQILYGREVSEEDLLKISQTALEDILNGEKELLDGGEADKSPSTPSHPIDPSSLADFVASNPSLLSSLTRTINKQIQSSLGVDSEEDRINKKRSRKSESEPLAIDEEEEENWDDDEYDEDGEEEGDDDSPRSTDSKLLSSGHKAQRKKSLHCPSPRSKIASQKSSLKWPSSQQKSQDPEAGSPFSTSSSQSGLSTLVPSSEGEVASSNIIPFPETDQLPYLEEGFQLIALMVRGNAARIKDDMKKEGTKGTWDVGEVKQSKRELLAKIRLHERKLDMRVQATKSLQLPCPRLEGLRERLNLDAFERNLILLIIGKTVSPVVKALMDALDGSGRGAIDDISVGQALSILCQDFATQVAYRRYFYKSSRLVSSGVINICRSRWHQSNDLTDQRLQLDRRLLDWIVGLDSEIGEVVEGSDLYEPKASLSQLVLPSGQADTLLRLCGSYEEFQKYLKDQSQRTGERFRYGNSLVILLCGKSGTGKTLTVNAIARHLGKKVLLVDLSALMGGKRAAEGESEADLRGLFRESQLSNALLFFDECEHIFRSRTGGGGDRLLNSLLTEIEKHSGMVFLATNRPQEIDEAMHRRITAVFEYKPPDLLMRTKIWQNLLGINPQLSSPPSSSSSNESDLLVSSTSSSSTSFLGGDILLSPSVDVSALAVKYELTGGFIKNAVLSALLSAIARNKQHQSTSGESSSTEHVPDPSEAPIPSQLLHSSSSSTLTPLLTQEDLVEGCRLQMRASMLTEKGLEGRIVPTCGFDSLLASPAQLEALKQIVRFERSRSLVYGSWDMGRLQRDSSLGLEVREGGNGGGAVGLPNQQLSFPSSEQRGCLCCFAGPVGAGKKTFAKAIAFELGRPIKTIHLSDLLLDRSPSNPDLLSILAALTHDARLSDSVLVLDGFEHMLLDAGAGTGAGGGLVSNMKLDRILSFLVRFPGCVILLCNIDNPHTIELQRSFALHLFGFIRFSVPAHALRAQLWKRLLPSLAPLASDVNFAELGRKFEFHPGTISAAVSRACAMASTRNLFPSSPSTNKTQESLEVRQKDLIASGEAEESKLKSSNFDAICKLFV